MDPLTALLSGPRARGAFVLRTVMRPPWALRIEDGAPLTVVAVVRGTAWLRPQRGGDRRLRPGDVAVVRGPRPYVMSSGPDTAPQVVVGPGQVCTTLAGEPLRQAMRLGVRTWGNAVDGTTELVTGTYDAVGAVGRRVVGALPEVIAIQGAEGGPGQWAGLLAAEAGRDAPGQGAVLDRLLDLVLVAAIRQWCASSGADAPGWWRAGSDPVVGPVLDAVHDAFGEPWTIERLARRAGVSRAALARRFTDLVGEPPISYLTVWRLEVAADLLLADDLPVEGVAHRVGYRSAFAFSTAFKRHHGVSPRDLRRAAAADVDGRPLVATRPSTSTP